MTDGEPGNPRETRAFVLLVTLAWAVALVVLLITDVASWWPWSAAAGVAIGALGLAFLSRRAP